MNCINCGYRCYTLFYQLRVWERVLYLNNCIISTVGTGVTVSVTVLVYYIVFEQLWVQLL